MEMLLEGAVREIRLHRDGYGLNDALRILADARDVDSGGGSSHRYEVEIGGSEVAVIQFQHGPRKAEGSTPGITEEVLLAILIDRLKGFQAGPFSCRENALTLTKLQEALHWSRHRADERAKRGVLGELAV